MKRVIARLTPLRILVAAATAAVLVVGAGLLVSALPTPGSKPGARASSTPGTSLVPASAAPASSATPGPASTIGPRTSTEVQTPDPHPTPLPAPTSLPVVFAGAVPKAASSSSRLVSSWPADLPVPQGVVVKRSSVSVDGQRVQAEYTATVPGDMNAALAQYISAFAAIGLSGATSASQPDQLDEIFSRGNDNVTVTVAANGSSTTITLFAALDYSS